MLDLWNIKGMNPEYGRRRKKGIDLPGRLIGRMKNDPSDLRWGSVRESARQEARTFPGPARNGYRVEEDHKGGHAP